MMHVEPTFPGAEIVKRGLEDLAQQRVTSDALALQVVAPRLRSLGYEVPTIELDDWPEMKLYLRLAEEGTPDPYGIYNAMLRRVFSFASAAEAAHSREQRRRVPIP